jgi:hypothetical protein
MNPPRLKTLFVALVVLVTGLLVYSLGHASRSTAQDAEKSLDIERYPNEPLELVDLKIGDQSVKNKIAVKVRKGEEGLDNVKFRDSDEWFKRMRITLVNVSGKTVVGMRAYLYFKVPNTQTLFSVQLARSKHLQLAALEPGAEVDLIVTDQLWSPIANLLKQSGADVNLAAVTFSVENVMFSDGLQWNRGHMLRGDPDNPNKWIPIETKRPQVVDFPAQRAYNAAENRLLY